MDNNDAMKDFLGEESPETDFGFEDQDNNLFGEDVEEKKEEVKENENKVSFAKDPKIQKYLQKQIEKALKDREPSSAQEQFAKDVAETTGDNDDLVSAFENIIGSDTPEKVHVLKMLKKGLSDVEEKASKKALSQLEQRTNAEKRAEKEADEALESSFEEIEETYGFDLTSDTPQGRKNYNEYKTFLRKIAPKNSEGEIIAMPDIVGAFELYKEAKGNKQTTSSNSRAKELASRSMARSGDSSASSTQPKERITWDTVQRLFD